MLKLNPQILNYLRIPYLYYMRKFRVQLMKDSTYEVIETINESEESVFQGSLSDCEAFIRLNEKGYM